MIDCDQGAVRAGDVMLGARHWPGAPAGVPVLLVHGLASNARVWDGVATRLAAERQVLAVDLRGHGASASVPDPPGSDPTLVAAYDLAWLCASRRWSQVVVVGHSWGGNIALQLAADCPNLVSGLALVDGGWLHESDRWGHDLDVVWRTKAPPDLTGWDLGGVREVLAGAHPDWPGQAVEATLANLEQCPDGALRPWLTPERHKARWASLLAHRPRELHRRVRCRTVMLAAGDPPDEPTRQAASSMAAALITFPGGEHDLHLQFPSRVAAAIARLG